MCATDLIILYSIGGGVMIFIALKLFGKGKKAKKKPDANPTSDHNHHPVSTE